ncbi:MAG: hypothetical protein ACFFHV_07840 [Promethearchaeota archaeon]
MKSNQYFFPDDQVQIINRYAVFSNLPDDPVFKNNVTPINKPIFCGGIINRINQNIYNFKINDFVVFISHTQELISQMSQNIVFKFANMQDLKLISIIPYASFAMKILRQINPKFKQSVLIYGLDFFSILLFKLIKISGTKVGIINPKEKDEIDGVHYKKLINDEIINDRINYKIDTLIISSEFASKPDKYLEKIKFKQKYHLNQISIHDIGYDDPYYKMGIKYPYSYVRWDYHRNLKYFLSLYNKQIIKLDYLKIVHKKVGSFNQIKNSCKNIEEKGIILLEY